MNAGCDPNILLQAEDLLVRRGGVTVLDIPALSVVQGQILVLIGPNGAGKSTLLLTLAGLLKPAQGSLLFRGERIGNGGFDYRRHIAMVFQEPLLFDATVFENVATGLKIRGVGGAEIGRTVPEYLERFGVGHLAKRSARKLSGGEAQRTSLARAFVTKPEIVFLDEPFSSLDPPTREGLTGDLEQILRETHTTAVASTHDQTEALRLADRLAVMNEGKIVQIGPVAEVMNRPADEFVASFVGVETVLPGRVLRTSDGVFTADVGGGEIQAVGHARAGDAVYEKKSQELLTKFYDAGRFIMNVIGPENLKPAHNGTKQKVAVHVSCHEKLGHKMGGSANATTEFLKAIPGVEVVAMKGADECCGQAGPWGLAAHYDLSVLMRKDKIANLIDSKADAVTSWCGGCMIQMRDGLGQTDSTIRVRHPLELLSEAYER